MASEKKSQKKFLLILLLILIIVIVVVLLLLPTGVKGCSTEKIAPVEFNGQKDGLGKAGDIDANPCWKKFTEPDNVYFIFVDNSTQNPIVKIYQNKNEDPAFNPGVDTVILGNIAENEKGVNAATVPYAYYNNPNNQPYNPDTGPDIGISTTNPTSPKINPSYTSDPTSINTNTDPDAWNSIWKPPKEAAPTCGDGKVNQPAEQCDDPPFPKIKSDQCLFGQSKAPGICDACACKPLLLCGNGELDIIGQPNNFGDFKEECDPGVPKTNILPIDRCQPIGKVCNPIKCKCEVPVGCRDERFDPATEECDIVGNQQQFSNIPACQARPNQVLVCTGACKCATIPVCGNGIVENGEGCEPGQPPKFSFGCEVNLKIMKRDDPSAKMECQPNCNCKITTTRGPIIIGGGVEIINKTGVLIGFTGNLTKCEKPHFIKDTVFLLPEINKDIPAQKTIELSTFILNAQTTEANRKKLADSSKTTKELKTGKNKLLLSDLPVLDSDDASIDINIDYDVNPSSTSIVDVTSVDYKIDLSKEVVLSDPANPKIQTVELFGDEYDIWLEKPNNDPVVNIVYGNEIIKIGDEESELVNITNNILVGWSVTQKHEPPLQIKDEETDTVRINIDQDGGDFIDLNIKFDSTPAQDVLGTLIFTQDSKHPEEKHVVYSTTTSPELDLLRWAPQGGGTVYSTPRSTSGTGAEFGSTTFEDTVFAASYLTGSNDVGATSLIKVERGSVSSSSITLIDTSSKDQQDYRVIISDSGSYYTGELNIISHSQSHKFGVEVFKDLSAVKLKGSLQDHVVYDPEGTEKFKLPLGTVNGSNVATATMFSNLNTSSTNFDQIGSIELSGDQKFSVKDTNTQDNFVIDKVSDTEYKVTYKPPLTTSISVSFDPFLGITSQPKNQITSDLSLLSDPANQVNRVVIVGGPVVDTVWKTISELSKKPCYEHIKTDKDVDSFISSDGKIIPVAVR